LPDDDFEVAFVCRTLSSYLTGFSQFLKLRTGRSPKLSVFPRKHVIKGFTIWVHKKSFSERTADSFQESNISIKSLWHGEDFTLCNRFLEWKGTHWYTRLSYMLQKKGIINWLISSISCILYTSVLVQLYIVQYKWCTLMFSKRKKKKDPYVNYRSPIQKWSSNLLVVSIWRSPTKYNMIPTKIIWSLYVGLLLYSLYYLLKELNRDPHWLIVLLKKKNNTSRSSFKR
jgi:hypothetical protein